MSDRIRVHQNKSGCWHILNGPETPDDANVLATFPRRMWQLAYEEARVQAACQNLSIISLEICS